jgi:hypothetical protein
MNEEIKVQVGDSSSDKEVIYNPKMKMILRKTLGGDFAIYDHFDIDIVVQPEKKQVLAFPKYELSDDVYAAQDRMFEFLSKKGVVIRDSVQSGFVYGSMQGSYPESSSGANAEEVVLYTLGKFLEEEKPYYSHEDALERDMNTTVTEPSDEDSTELGEVPQEKYKGSIPKYPAAKSYYRVY